METATLNCEAKGNSELVYRYGLFHCALWFRIVRKTRKLTTRLSSLNEFTIYWVTGPVERETTSPRIDT
jgi:hypothetical protein